MKNFNRFICKNNNKDFRRKCQQRNVLDVSPNSIFLKDPYSFITENFTSAHISALDYILSLSNNYNYLYPSQSHMAKLCGFSRKHINEVLQYLRELGLIDYNYRHRNTCQYKVSSWFNNLDVRKLLRKILSSLYFLPIASIMASEANLQGDVTPLNIIHKEEKLSYGESYNYYLWFNYHRVELFPKTEEDIQYIPIEVVF